MATIKRLTAENVRRLRVVEIEPSGSVVVIGGKNENGKSSVLDSIEYALSGKAVQCEKPVREGAKKARIVCELDDLIIKRTITPDGGGSLVVESRDGARYPSPQGLLDKLASKIGFDPLAFARKKPAEQLNTLKELVGLNFDALDTRRAKLYAQRTALNRQVRDAKAILDDTPRHLDAPKEEVSVSELLNELSYRERIIEQNKDEREAIEIAEKGLVKLQEDLGTIEQEIKRLTTERDNLLAQIRATFESIEKARKKVSKLVDPDVTEIRAQIAGAEEVNAKIRANRKWAEEQKRYRNFKASADTLTKQIEDIDTEKARKMAAAKWPIEGLGFDEEGVLYQGLRFNEKQLSSAQILRVSVAIGLAMHPELKVLLIRDGSLLDEDNLAIVRDMAEGAGAQVWIERVGDGSECQVIIEDGYVRGAANAPESDEEAA